MSKPLVIRMDGNMVAEVDDLYKLYNVLSRNTPPDCELTKFQVARQVLDIAHNNLRSSHVYEVNLLSGDSIVFVGNLPNGTSMDTVRRAIERREVAV